MADASPAAGLPRAALFDIDGTLFESERLWADALALTLEPRGIRARGDALSPVIYGKAWPDAFAALRAHFPEALAGDTAAGLGRELCLAFERLFAAAPPVIVPAVNLLRRLRAAGVPCAYVSGSPRATILHDLRAAGIADLLDLARSVPSDDVTHGKPDPEGYRLAMRRLGVAPDAVAVFEDSRVGALAALAAGAGRVYVCPPPSAPPQTYPPGALRLPSWDAAFPGFGASWRHVRPTEK